MCIIAIKKKGTIIEDEVLETMFTNNPDGVGYMYAWDNKVEIRKGYMSFEGFKKSLKTLPDKMENLSMIFHFRITTSGGTKKSNCHPFPITNNNDELKATKISTEFGICHNGVITMDIEKGLSDSMSFIKNELYYIYKNDNEFYKNENTCKMIKNRIGSRLAFLLPTGETFTIGDGFVEDNGIIYSNTSYKPYISKYSNYSTPFDDYDYSFYGEPIKLYMLNKHDTIMVKWNEDNKIAKFKPYDSKTHDVQYGVDMYGNLYETDEEYKSCYGIVGAVVLNNGNVTLIDILKTKKSGKYYYDGEF